MLTSPIILILIFFLQLGETTRKQYQPKSTRSQQELQHLLIPILAQQTQQSHHIQSAPVQLQASQQFNQQPKRITSLIQQTETQLQHRQRDLFVYVTVQQGLLNS